MKRHYAKEAVKNQPYEADVHYNCGYAYEANDDFLELKKYCEQIEIGFLSTPFDEDSIWFLDSLDMDSWKIPSGEITNYPYLGQIAQTGREYFAAPL